LKICFVGNFNSSFVKQDLDILKKHFDVDAVQIPKRKLDSVGWIELFLALRRKVKECDVIFSWFADLHSAFAVHFSKKYGKKSVVVVGGYDAAKVPEMKYGSFTNLNEGMPARYVLKNADCLLAVSEFTKSEIFDRVGRKDVRVVYNGVDIQKIDVPDFAKKEKLILTIGDVTKRGVKMKGLETFAKASLSFPGLEFVIIGRTDEKQAKGLRKINPRLIFTGFLDHDDALKWLSRTKVYCQLSYRESFGMGLAEAMACGCAPVITNRGALPEVVGDCGIFAKYGDPHSAASAIKSALDSPRLGKMARERIGKFGLKARERVLYKIIQNFKERYKI
jgi:glycosyltransferase involved in cell wall biosynthesis